MSANQTSGRAVYLGIFSRSKRREEATMRRREFLRHSAYQMGAAWLASQAFAKQVMAAPLASKFKANDTVPIGKTGIKASRLAMGTGTVGSGHHSHQT